MFDLGLLFISNDFRAEEESKDSLRDKTTAAGARPIFSLDSTKCWGKTCESTVCEAFNSSLSPSENNQENALRLKIMTQWGSSSCKISLWNWKCTQQIYTASNLKSAFDIAKMDKNWFIDIPTCRSHQGIRNSSLLFFFLQACHCIIRRLLGTVSPPPAISLNVTYTELIKRRKWSLIT